MTIHQMLAAGLVLLGGAVLVLALVADRLPEATAKGGAGSAPKVVLAASATDPLVPALADQGPGDPFTQRMIGRARQATVPLPPPPPIDSPEPPLLPVIGR